jgi:hypothetical protein
MNLLTASSFAVLAATTVTNTGNTQITGNLGLHPGTSVTGFPPGVVHGSMHVEPLSGIAQDDLTDAYIATGGLAFEESLAGDISGRTFAPGVFKANSSLAINGEITLDGMGLYIFQIASTLVTGSGSIITLAGGADVNDVFWCVGSSATLGTYSQFSGTIMAMSSITVTTGATVKGRLLARNGAVTLDTNLLEV